MKRSGFKKKSAPPKARKPVVRFRREAGFSASVSTSVKDIVLDELKRTVRDSTNKPRCPYIFPEHGHGHQQCTREAGHPGAHWCGWKGKGK